METNLILEGFKFMGLGMGTVFSFLIIMILSMNLMSIIVHKFFPEPQGTSPAAMNTKKNKNKIIAAISAAISHHRQG